MKEIERDKAMRALAQFQQEEEAKLQAKLVEDAKRKREREEERYMQAQMP